MKRITQISSSTLGRRVSVRVSRKTFDAIREQCLRNPSVEQFAFGLFSLTRAADETVLIMRTVLFPSAEDLTEQSGGYVAPSKDFQASVYLIAQQGGLGILDIHTHLGESTPYFSGIDEAESAKNAKYVCKEFPPPITLAMIVFNGELTAHDAVIYDRSLNGYRQIDSIQILGHPNEIRPTGERCDGTEVDDPRYSRQVMIPGWDQANVSRQKIAIVGMGGNGAQLFPTLLSLGVGTQGWIAAIDPDIVEESNLSRIPYAFPEHVGSPKVTLAAQYAGHKSPGARFYPYPCSVTDQAAIDRIKAATVLFGAGDSDGVRKVCNELSVRYGIPYIDLGCDIQIDGADVLAGGQVRVVVPGVNACLVCSNGFDPATAAMDLMDDARKTMHAARGYVRGGRSQATPSVANLNATTAQLGVTAFLALVHGKRFGNWDYAHYDQLTGQTLTAGTKPRKSCPLCGPEGILAVGDEQEVQPAEEPSWAQVEAAE